KGMSHARIGESVQLTAKVDPASQLKSFLLKPTGGETGYRLVLDLYPGGDTTAAVANATAKAPAGTAPVVAAPVATPTYSNPTHSSRVAAEHAAAMLNGQRQVVVAVDAGHGGKDPGSHGPSGTLE